MSCAAELSMLLGTPAADPAAVREQVKREVAAAILQVCVCVSPQRLGAAWPALHGCLARIRW
jgi:hypothetical protein